MKVLEELNKKFNNKYHYLRIESTEIIKKSLTVKTVVLVPREYIGNVFKEEEKTEVRAFFESLIPEKFGLDINFKNSYIDESIVKKFFRDYIKQIHPALIFYINLDEITVEIKSDVVNVKIPLDTLHYDFLNHSNDALLAEKYMSYKFCKVAKIEYLNKGNSGIFNNNNINEEDLIRYSKLIKVVNQKHIAGSGISRYADYITNINDLRENVVFAGKITKVESRITKKNTQFFIMEIDDTTAKITVKYFRRTMKENKKYDDLATGAEIIVEGKLVYDSFAKDNALIATKISVCEIDWNSIVMADEYAKVPSYYTHIFPQKETAYNQASIFSEAPKFMLGEKEYVVFDLETTGLSKEDDKIIEIGAVKIIDDKICESFSCLVNPQRHIPANINLLTGIYDKDVANALTIYKVFPDFMKFIDGAVLVAHNASFDIGFIGKIARELKFKLINTVICTKKLSSKFLHLKNNKLGTVCEHFDVIIGNAHRAVFDAVATAKIFIKMAHEFGVNNF